MKTKVKHKMAFLAFIVSVGIFTCSFLTLNAMKTLKADHLMTVSNTLQEIKESGGIDNAHGENLLAAMEGAMLQTNWVQRVIVSVTVGLVILCSIMAVFASKIIINPIVRLKEMAQLIADGDFITEVDPVKGNDELRELYEHFVMIRRNLREILSDLSINGEQVSTAAQELHATSNQIVDGLQNQSEKDEQIASAVEELNVTLQEMASNANHSLESSELMVQTADHGNLKTNETIESMKRISNILNEAAMIGGTLARKTQEVGTITRVIDDIVEQTHLLAFNAAIEAAQAGEQGRGFAVVADEVRKLSERTSKATKEIAKTIEEIQGKSGDTVAAMCEGIEEVDVGTAKTEEAGKALQCIVESVAKVKDMVTQIATAAEEGSQASNQIAMSVDENSNVSKMMAMGSEESLKATLDLSQLASELQQKITVFQVRK